jgi:hypothetical protein
MLHSKVGTSVTNCAALFKVPKGVELHIFVVLRKSDRGTEAQRHRGTEIKTRKIPQESKRAFDDF